jgi:hypothetical protein
VFNTPQKRPTLGEQYILSARPPTLENERPIFFSKHLLFHLRKTVIRKFRNSPLVKRKRAAVDVGGVSQGVFARSHSIFVLETPPLTHPSPLSSLLGADISLQDSVSKIRRVTDHDSGVPLQRRVGSQKRQQGRDLAQFSEDAGPRFSGGEITLANERIARTEHTEAFTSQKTRPGNMSDDLLEFAAGEPPQG